MEGEGTLESHGRSGGGDSGVRLMKHWEKGASSFMGIKKVTRLAKTSVSQEGIPVLPGRGSWGRCESRDLGV
jgi:hypothetical protein